jgi:hypothetical protein
MRNNYRIEDSLVFIELKRRDGNNFECFIDKDSFDKVNALDVTWFSRISYGSKLFYPVACLYLGTINKKAKYKLLYLARYLLDAKTGEFVDHIDHNPMNATIGNMRIASNRDNSRHRKSKNSNNNSGFRNVCLIGGFWRVQLQANGKNHMFKEKFITPEEASIFAEEMRKKYYREFAGNN